METTQPWNLIEEAFEIIDIQGVILNPTQPVLTYKSADDPAIAGDNEIPDDVWPDYTPPLPYLKNTTRNLQFNESQFIASPGAPIGTTTYVATPDDYTWAFMSEAINTMWPYDAADYEGLPAQSSYHAGNFVITPPPDVVKVTANYKGQNLRFWANENGVEPGSADAVPLDRYFVTDPWGNEYIMHASGQNDPSQVASAFEAAVLPEGWTKEVRQLSENLTLHPAEGADGTFHYVVIRDSADNSYHQITWSDTGSLAGQTESMPIWGGNDDNVLAGDVGGIWDDLIHGAGGDDTLVPGLGDDTIWGDADTDTVVLPGASTDYAWIDASDDRTYVAMTGFGYTKEIYHAEFLQFDNETVAIADFIDSTPRFTADPTAPKPPLPVAFRLRDPLTGSHVFTASLNEVDTFIDEGWEFESVPFRVNPPGNSAQDVYRLNHPTRSDFLLTTSETERDAAIEQGYVNEGVVFTAYDRPAPLGSDPVYRFFSPSGTDRLYTTSNLERLQVEAMGYQYEGIAFYADSFYD